MTKEEFIKLFELEKIYEKYKNKKSIVFGLLDNQTGTENAIFYIIKENEIKIIIECEEFSKENKIQKLEIHLKFSEDKTELNNNELFINEIFPFLTFDTNLDDSLKFIANFINKILIPKYNLMGSIKTY